VSAEPTVHVSSIRDPDAPSAAHRSIDQREALAARLFLALPEARQALLLHVSGLLDEIAFGNVVIVLQDATSSRSNVREDPLTCRLTRSLALGRTIRQGGDE
jgi:hypothetical protein